MSDHQISYRSPSYYETRNPGATHWRDFRDEAYRDYRKEWDSRPVEHRPERFPLHLDIDPTNACNLKCTMCPRTHYLDAENKYWAPDGRIGFMDFDFYKMVIDQAASEGCYSIKLNYLGEPLLHPKVVGMVDYAARAGLEVMMNTNATLLTSELSERLLDAGLSDIFFSVDSPYKREYERIRVGAKFENVIENVKGFIEAMNRSGKRHVQTRVSMVLQSEGDTSKIRRDYRNLFTDIGVAEIGFGLPTEMDVDYWEAHGKVEGFTCRDPYHRMFIYWDGKIGPCCGEWERGLVMGDATHDLLTDVWHNKKYKALRRAHEEGRYEDIPICKKCSVPWLSTREVEA